MNPQVEYIRQILLDNNYRLTNSRATIIDVLVQTAGHITADELVTAVREVAPRVGRMTVYRTLDLLSELGAVRPIYQGTGAAHFILLADGSHHHLICNRCHTVIEFNECMAESITEQLAQRFNFTISSHLLELHGICADCKPA